MGIGSLLPLRRFLPLFLAAFLITSRPGPVAAEDVDPIRVTEAVEHGIAALRKPGVGFQAENPMLELMVYTFLHAGVPASDPDLAKGIEAMRGTFPPNTYRIAFRAMAIETLGPNQGRDDLLDCAQFLVDAQNRKGSWSYGQEIPLPREGGTRTSGVPRFEKRFQPKSDIGDNSCTQFAILGLAACGRAGIVIPKVVWERARKHLSRSQNGDGGWGYTDGGDSSYGSMTCGGITSTLIVAAELKDGTLQRSIGKGIAWLTKHFTVSENPEEPKYYLYYYLYGLERVGALGNLRNLGKHDWYQEGARILIDQQDKKGSWGADYDTCFAILFLRQATRTFSSTSSDVNPPEKK